MEGPRTEIATEYLMTLHAPLDAPQIVNDRLHIYNVLPGGWIRGPRIAGEVIAPSADWLSILPDGTARLDVRVSIRADDDSIIYVIYSGRIVISDEAQQRLDAGEALGSTDMYFITSPTFETTSKKYDWLNRVVTVGKIVSTSGGNQRPGHVRYDIFMVK
jgi:hypothetical protein